MADEVDVSVSSTNLKSVMTKSVPEETRRSGPDDTDINEADVIVRKLHTVTAGLQKYVYKQLTEQVSKQNSVNIALQMVIDEMKSKNETGKNV